MRIFKYIAILFLILIIAFFSIGLFVPAISYSNKVTVNAPLEKTFAAFIDTALMKSWIPGFMSITTDTIPYAPGSKWKLLLVQDGQRYEMTETVTAFRPNEQYSYLLENAVLQNQVDVYFKGSGDVTEITASNKIKGNNIIWRSIFYFYKKDFIKQGQDSYNNLKKLVEAMKI